MAPLISYNIRPPKGIIAWHATRSSLLEKIFNEGLKYGSIELFFHCLPISRRPIEVFSGPARGSHLARDVCLEIDLTGSDLLVTGTSNFDYVLEPNSPIGSDKIRVMKMDEVLSRANESEWIPCQEAEKEFVFQEEFSVFLSLPILREIGWAEHSIVGKERVPKSIRQLPIDEAMVEDNSNLRYWLELSSRIRQDTMTEIRSQNPPTPVPIVRSS